MGISDRMLGKKNVNGQPQIEAVHPGAALPGGEERIIGNKASASRDAPAASSIWRCRRRGSHQLRRVPGGARARGRVFGPHDGSHQRRRPAIRTRSRSPSPIAENLHPVTNPALDPEGNIYVTFSGARGQKVPVAIYKIDTNYNVKPFLEEMMNATAIAFDRDGQMYVSSRYDGTVYRVAPNGTMSAYAEGMGVATGIAFDRNENLYVGDRSGTISRSRRPPDFVFARWNPASRPTTWRSARRRTLRHRPTTSSFDSIYKINPHGGARRFLPRTGPTAGTGLRCGRQPLRGGVAAGKRGIVRITPDARPRS